ncbi:MAG: hypothetical protein A2W93_10725 [Bacteroidetes bacterium GWF2_43_63]|nr:MAG: hypothetical protein A2W94_01735 [Bacteroidetes bacterium GWE2_42_42]OFY52987.1 MAG: hypothetical protein A2W93_10725 [Bacteroidetes bacterium GWF2_43_63]
MSAFPSQQDLDTCYGTYSYGKAINAPDATKASYQKLLQEFEPYRKTNRILDYGCGQGWFLEEAKKRGWEVWGVEYSDAAIRLGKEKNIKILTLEEANNFEQGFFDIIVMIEVLEHVTDIHEPMTKANTWLRPGGLFYCTTPNFNSIERYYSGLENFRIITWPEHLNYFTRKTLCRIAKKHCFTKKKVLTTGLSFSLKKTKKTLDDGTTVITNTDEQIREKINGNVVLRLLKKIANTILTITGLGVTLKGYFIKPTQNKQ